MPKSHQFKIREKLLAADLYELELRGIDRDEITSLRTDDFSFRFLEDESDKEAARAFIKKYEWLGTVGQLPSYYFATYYDSILGGVILLSVPNTKHHLLGTDGDYELLIVRGACASWTPKNLASKFLMQCIDWCVNNTDYRVFTAYADTEAAEIGTIYQACRFYYLGDNFGMSKKIRNPYSGKWVSDRGLRRYTMYRNHAKALGIEWQESWIHPQHPRRILWGNIPPKYEELLRKKAKDLETSAEFKSVAPKHKYVFIKGRDRRETKQLRKRFATHTPVYPYPKRQ